MAKAKTIRNKVRFNYVGVFKNHDIKDIVDHAYALKLAAVQLHGNENQEYIDTLKSKLHKNCQIWNAYGVKTRIPVFMENVDYHLLDTKIGTQTGGTGKKFDWTLIEDTKKIILAGGIGPSNISEAIKIDCSALDLNSGVEYKTGEKSFKKLQEVFSEIRNY
jgi:indole-3-glycerol phosphate synthase/phosphoribosylanthranilate isomerase